MQPTSLIAPLLLLAVASTAVAAPPQGPAIDHSATPDPAPKAPGRCWPRHSRQGVEDLPGIKWAFTSQVRAA
jgi:hypothetical protein